MGMGMVHGLFNHRLLFTAPTFTERIQPASFSGLAQTSVTTSLWIISDGDDDEVVMEHCCVAAVSVSARLPSITDRPSNYLPADLSTASVAFFLSTASCIGWARCWVNVDIASSYLIIYSTLYTDMIMLLNITQASGKCFFTS